MKKIFASLLLLLGLTSVGWAQTERQFTFTTTSSSVAIYEVGTGITQHLITWNGTGTVSTCSVKVEKSATGSSGWTDLIAATTCTTNGFSAITAGTANYVRVTLSTFSGGGGLVVRYNGYPVGIPVTATIDPTGLATSAKQDTGNGYLATIAGAVVPVSLSCPIVTTASTNSTSCKASAGNRLGGWFVNPTATIAYVRLYNSATAPTCSSATGFISPAIPIPAATTGAGITFVIPNGVAFATGLGYCVTGGPTSTDNTNAVADVRGELFYN